MSGEQDFSIEAAMTVRSILRMLRPHRVEGVTKLRVGRHYDGGYTMLDKFSNIEAAYSLGINDEVSWDWDIAQRGIKLRQYDHTIDGLPYEHPMFNWRKVGISGKPDPERNLQSLEELMRENGDTGKHNLLLKCDIEGYEWDMLMHTPNTVLRQFSQIVMELHNIHHIKEVGPADAVRKSLSNLYASHRAVHVHANNYGGTAVVGGYPLPCVLEVTFARLDTGVFTASDESFPTALDMPCNKDAADIYLGRFDFH